MIQNTVQKTIGDNREQELTQEVLRLQEQVDTLVAQREMLQKALYQKSNTTESQKD